MHTLPKFSQLSIGARKNHRSIKRLSEMNHDFHDFPHNLRSFCIQFILSSPLTLFNFKYFQRRENYKFILKNAEVVAQDMIATPTLVFGIFYFQVIMVKRTISTKRSAETWKFETLNNFLMSPCRLSE